MDYTDIMEGIGDDLDEHERLVLAASDDGWKDVLYLDVETDIGDDHRVGLFTRRVRASDGTPAPVWEGRQRWLTLAEGPGLVDLDRVREDLAEGGRLAVLLDTLRAGFEIDGNRRGILTEDAVEAEEAIASFGERGVYVSDETVWNEALYWGEEYPTVEEDGYLHVGEETVRTGQEMEALVTRLTKEFDDAFPDAVWEDGQCAEDVIRATLVREMEGLA